MIPYFVVVFILLILHNKQFYISKGVKNILLMYIALFLCGGYMCGSDWRSYELDYTSQEESLILEPGYYFLAKFASMIGLGFWEYEMLLKFGCLLIFYRYIDKHCLKNKYLCLLFYFSFYAIYLFIDGPLRNLCAISLFIVALDVYERSKVSAICLSLIDLLFHSSSIIAFIYFIGRIINERKEINTWIYISVYIVAIYISLQGSYFIELMNRTTIGRLLFAEKLDRYVVDGFGAASMVSSPLSLGELLKIFFFFLVVLRRRQIQAVNEGRTLFYSAMVFFIVSKIGASVNVLSRFDCYFSIFYALVLTVMIDAIVPSLKKVYRALFILLSMLITSATVTTDYRFVPYTNYVVYALFHQPLPSYDARFYYNFKNSPYK